MFGLYFFIFQYKIVDFIVKMVIKKLFVVYVLWIFFLLGVVEGKLINFDIVIRFVQ